MHTNVRLNPEPSVADLPSAGPAAPAATSSIDSLAAAMQSGSIVSQIESQIENFRRLCNETTKRASELEGRESEVRRLTEEIARKDAELKSRIESFGREAAEVAAKVDAESARLEDERRRENEARERFESERQELLARQQELDSKREQAENLRREVESREAELRQREEAIGAAQTRATQAAEDATRRQAEAQAQNEKAERLAAEALRKVQHLESELTNAMAALAQAFHDREQMETQRGDLQKAIDAGAVDRDRCVTLEKEVVGLTQRLGAAEARAAVASPGAAADALSALQSQLDQARAELAQREEMLAVLTARLLSCEEQALTDRATIATVNNALEKASRQIAEMQEHPATLSAVTAAKTGLRRERLARYKRLLSTQSDKLVRAKAALKKRMEECDQVLAQRQRIAEASAIVERQQQIIASKQARKGALAWVAYSVATIVLVGVIAWHVAGQVAPASYAATATVAPDAKGREVTADEAAAWGESLQQLAKDPQVLAAAAENYSRRGMGSLANVASVKQKLDADLYVKAEPSGAIKLELRGQGRERTARELETFMSALLSEAERQKDQRADGLATTVSHPPTAGTEPLDSQRLFYAAAMTGGGLLACTGLGLVLYRMLLRSRLKFELEQQALEAA